jgi:hypothetical protein
VSADTSRFRIRRRALSEEAMGLHDAITAAAAEVERHILYVPEGRERSLALINLDEAVMWAVKGLSA